MAIEPDTKDWTWVLDRPCPECGFEAAAFERTDVGAMIRASVREWERLLSDPGARDRSVPDRWSALEYACHVRDVFRLYDDRLVLMLTDDDPEFANWDQDATAVADRYGEQAPVVVAAELAAAGEALAASFDALGKDQWTRTGRRSDGASFTVESFARYFVHDPIHHVHDVETAAG
ncbi:MAG TPA: DinB family protein [Acidimicrobiia bacterium]|nr:DinB family protein [Acidimicrobiia bacterium]